MRYSILLTAFVGSFPCAVASAQRIPASCPGPSAWSSSGCPPAGQCVRVEADLTLNPTCHFQDVEFWIMNVYGSGGRAQTWRHASRGNAFAYRTGLQTLAAFTSLQRWLAGDFDGDGKDDLLNVYPANVW